MLRLGDIIAVCIQTIRRAELSVAACQNCDPTADTPFGRVLSSVTGLDHTGDCLMPEAAHCPACGASVLEHTLVEVHSPD